jgi:hypothetical protein
MTNSSSRPSWSLVESGFAFGRGDQLIPECRGLLAQLEDEGLVELCEPDGWTLTWSSAHALCRLPQYSDAPALLGLPPLTNIAPTLESKGSLTDPHFIIAIAGWSNSMGGSVQVEFRVGPVVSVDGRDALLSEAAWALRKAIIAFLNRSQTERNDKAQRRAWSHIRQLALTAGARLDHFLYSTVVLTPSRLSLGLRRAELSGGKVVEVIPSFEGCPPQWLPKFDALPRVPERYDIITEAGVVQVLVTPEVRTVLEQVKRMPGRRVAGARAEAFVSNPFATLGQDASKVLDPEQFEQAREDAGLLFERFTAHIERDAQGYPEKVGILIERPPRESELPQSDLVPFADDDELANFIDRVTGALEAQRQLCMWEDAELEMTGDTAVQLQFLKAALTERASMRVLVRYDDVYDLTKYSARVDQIGLEQNYYSPFIARPPRQWIPDEVEGGLIFVPDGQTEPVAVPLSPDVREELRRKVEEAVAAGKSEVTFSAISKHPVPVGQAKEVLDTLEAALADIRKGDFDPEKPKPDRSGDEKRVSRVSLLIKPNIQSIDYEEARREALRPRPHPALPNSLRGGIALKEHQLQGVAVLQGLMDQCPKHCRGAILADDMGLGKTLQILTVLAAAFEAEPGLSPALIVAPVSLLDNWKEEIQKFFLADALPTLTAYSDALNSLRLPRAQIDEQLQRDGLIRFLKPEWRGNARIVLTTYETLRDLEFSFATEKWSVMVCDEAQKIKNPNALVTRAAKKQNVVFKIACTGTPVENTLADLWCLFDFVQPGLLGALNDFGRRYRKPIEAKTDEEKMLVEELRRIIAPQVIRRLKKDVAKDLPAKIEVEACRNLPMSAFQRTLYSQAIEMFKRRGESGVPFKNALGLLHHLRLLCTDPKPRGRTQFVAEPLREYRSRSPKLHWLLDELEAIKAKGEKVILFCEFREVQRMLRYYVNDTFGFEPDIINGDTPVSARHQASRHRRIEEFQKRPGFNIIILSPVAVGFGVNIQSANHVIHYTRAWNPAKEDQATDRAYRIGQEKDVYVYYPVVTAEFKTFDERLDELLRSKRNLAQDMLNGAGDITPGEFDPRNIAPTELTDVLEEPVTLDDVLRMQPRYFEAFVAALWEKRGYDYVYKTPDAGDGGVDVVAISPPQGELVQCKSSTVDNEEMSWEAIKDVVAGEAAYRARHPGVDFRKACVTNQFFNANAVYQARMNGVDLFDQARLVGLMKTTPLTMLDVERFLYLGWEQSISGREAVA